MLPLNTKEQDLLERLDQNEKLRPLFFQKVVGVKWFQALNNKNYFLPSSNPKPRSSGEDGSINIPQWMELGYLVRTAPELEIPENIEIAKAILKLIQDITLYSEKEKIANFRTYWQLSQVIYYIPIELINEEVLSIIDIWLNDQYRQNLVFSQLSEKWLLKLLEINSEKSVFIAYILFAKLMKLNFVNKNSIFGRTSLEVEFLADSYHAKKAIQMLAYKSGLIIGIQIVQLFHNNLNLILKRLKNDSWSNVWHPAIENHEQNKHREDPEHLTILGYRESLKGLIENNLPVAEEHIQAMFKSKSETIIRIAIHAIDHHFDSLIEMQKALNHSPKYLTTNFRHEYWNYLHNHFSKLKPEIQAKILNNIDNLSFEDDKGKKLPGRVAYQKAIWLSAIKHCNSKILRDYKKQTKLAKTEPDNPSFSSYATFGTVTHKSPFTLVELQSLSLTELLEKIVTFKEPEQFAYQLPDLQGFTKTINQLIRSSPLNYIDDLYKFSQLDPAFIYEIIEAYKGLWSENQQLPWDEIWPKLLKFCEQLISKDNFWTDKQVDRKGHLIGTREWVVTSIARLIVSGVQSDDHAFDKKHNKLAKRIVLLLLQKQNGETYDLDNDSVFRAINSPRGNCLEALINLSLRMFRTSSKKNHEQVWAEFESIYTYELLNTSVLGNEFSALITNYLPNFIYMSEIWVLDNLPKIFNQNDQIHWLAAVQGYGYVGNVDPRIYNYLDVNNDYLKALDSPFLKDNIKNVMIDNIVIAYFYEIDLKPEPSIYKIIERNIDSEISHLIWFVWTLRKDADKKFKEKLYLIWKKIFSKLSLELKDHKKIASRLVTWSIFIDDIDEEGISLIMKIADLAEYDYNSTDLFIAMAKISEKDPMISLQIWKKLLTKSTPDYPEETIKIILKNSLKTNEGKREAKKIVSIYLERGNENPHKWLIEISSLGNKL